MINHLTFVANPPDLPFVPRDLTAFIHLLRKVYMLASTMPKVLKMDGKGKNNVLVEFW